MKLSLLLRCKDLEETRNFYASMLGFPVRDCAEDTLTVECGDGTLLFTAADLWRQSIGLSGTIYLTDENVEGRFASLDPSVHIEWPIQDMPYGSREFGIRDCNGYLLAFQQRRPGS